VHALDGTVERVWHTGMDEMQKASEGWIVGKKKKKKDPGSRGGDEGISTTII